MYKNYRSCCCCNNQNNSSIENTCSNNNVSENNNNNTTTSSCGFNKNSIFPANPMLAQSYVPIQYMDKTFTPYCGLKNGTMFPELVTYYYPGQSMMDIDYLRMATNT